MVMQYFHEGGYGMWVLLGLGWAVLGVGVLFAIGEERARWPAWGLSAAGVVIGALFMMRGRAQVDDAVVGVEPEMMQTLSEQGYREAARPLELGVGLAVLGAALAGVGELRRRKK